MIELEPKNERNFYKRFRVFLSKRKYAEAIQDLSRALELKPKYKQVCVCVCVTSFGARATYVCACFSPLVDGCVCARVSAARIPKVFVVGTSAAVGAGLILIVEHVCETRGFCFASSLGSGCTCLTCLFLRPPPSYCRTASYCTICSSTLVIFQSNAFFPLFVLTSSSARLYITEL